MSKRSAWVVGAVVLVAAAGTTTAAVARNSGPSTEELLSATLGKAMASAHTSFAVPQAAEYGRKNAAQHIATTPAFLKSQAPVADLEDQRVAGTKDLAQSMTGSALEKNVAVMNRWLDSQEPGKGGDPNFRPLGGGVTDVRLTHVDVSGGEATVEAEVDEWAAMADLGADGSVDISKPSGTTIVDAHFVFQGGRWLVDDYSWKFAPGSEP